MKKRCPKHDVPLMLRQNAKTGEIALACPYCDVEAHGGSGADRQIVSDAMKKSKDKDRD